MEALDWTICSEQLCHDSKYTFLDLPLACPYFQVVDNQMVGLSGPKVGQKLWKAVNTHTHLPLASFFVQRVGLVCLAYQARFILCWKYRWQHCTVHTRSWRALNFAPPWSCVSLFISNKTRHETLMCKLFSVNHRVVSRSNRKKPRGRLGADWFIFPGTFHHLSAPQGFPCSQRIWLANVNLASLLTSFARNSKEEVTKPFSRRSYAFGFEDSEDVFTILTYFNHGWSSTFDRYVSR